MPAIQSVSLNSGSSSSPTVSRPSGVQNGDLIVLCVSTQDLRAITFPTGFKVYHYENNGDVWPTHAMAAKFADGEPTSYSLPLNSSTGWHVAAVRIDDVDEFLPVGQTTSASGGGSPLTSVSIDIFDNTLLLWSAVWRKGLTSVDYSSGFVKHWQKLDGSTGSSGNPSVVGAVKFFASGPTPANDQLAWSPSQSSDRHTHSLSFLTDVGTIPLPSVDPGVRQIVISGPIGWSTFNVPLDWDNEDNTIEVIGAGGGGGRGRPGGDWDGAGGGGGGDYVRVENVELTPGGTIAVRVGEPGLGGVNDGDDGSDGLHSVVRHGTAEDLGDFICRAAGGGGGRAAPSFEGGQGGVSASNIGDFIRKGGNGGDGGDGSDDFDSSGGGGGAAGPHGDGGHGGDGTTSGSSSGSFGGGGGGANNGGDGGDNSGGEIDPFSGGVNRNGIGGGYNCGFLGGGGGGGWFGGTPGHQGGMEPLWRDTDTGEIAGPGGGGGGSTFETVNHIPLEFGGLYGGGGGGVGDTPGYHGGDGAQGVVIITYRPVVPDIPSINFPVDSGAILLEGGEVQGPLHHKSIVAECGLLEIQGQDAATQRDRRFPVEHGTAQVSGQDARLLHGHAFSVEPGAASLAGQEVNTRIIEANVMEADVGKVGIQGGEVFTMHITRFVNYMWLRRKRRF